MVVRKTVLAHVKKGYVSSYNVILTDVKSIRRLLFYWVKLKLLAKLIDNLLKSTLFPNFNSVGNHNNNNGQNNSILVIGSQIYLQNGGINFIFHY